MAKRKPKAQPLPLLVVTELELLTVRTMREQVEKMARDLKKAAYDLALEETNVITKLKRGAPVVGRLTAFLDKVPGQYSPSYKTELMEHMKVHHGFEEIQVDAILRKKYVPTERTKLEIDEKLLEVL